MVDAPTTRLWVMRATYLLLALFMIFLQLLPLNTLPPRFAPPDLLLVLTFIWVARRPDFVPVLSIAAVFLLTDLLFLRPPGLYTALILISTETLRVKSRNLRNSTFTMEWLTVSVVIVGLAMAYRVASSLTALDQAPLWLTSVQLILTLMIYPVIAVLSQLIFGILRPAPGEVDALGHHI